MYCQLFAKFRADDYTSADLAQMVKLIQMFGGTPADRVRLAGLATETKPEDNPYSEFTNQ